MPTINFAGLASGIDTESLIEATADATRLGRVEPYEDKISELQDTTSAIEELSSKFSQLKSIAESFSSLNGGPISKEVTSTDETVVTASASNAAKEGNYNLTVTQTATNGMATFYGAGTYTTSTDIINAGAAGDVVVNVGGTDYTMTCTNSTTLADFTSDFNGQCDTATASIVDIGTEDSHNYVVMISTDETGTKDGAISVTDASGMWDSETVTSAQDAQFQVAGITGTITRYSNTVNDLFTGVTFELNSAGTSNLKVRTDTTTTQSTIEEFVDIMNEITAFIEDNDAVNRVDDSEGAENIFGPLAKTTLDNSALQSVKSVMSSSSVSGGDVNIFADMGITTERDGTLKFDEDTFQEALGKDSDSLGQILQNFSDEVSITGGTIDQYIRFNGLFDLKVSSHDEQIKRHQEQISSAEDYIARTEEQMRARFARLEAAMSAMQSQQSQLTSILGGI